MSSSKDFYRNLPELESFFQFSNEELYLPLPADWFLALTDIVDSTNSIESGEYRSVNILGAAPIAGMFNYVEQNEIPYTFGGDGAMMAIPPHKVDDARNVLSTCKKIGTKVYDLELRAALIPVSYLYEREKEVKVARFRASPYYIQALFSGSGIRYSEQILKDSANTEFNVDISDNEAPARFTKLECRWQEVKNGDKEVITLLVEKNPAFAGSANIYENVMEKLRTIYGFDNKTNPITAKGLKMKRWVGSMKDEVNVRTFGLNWAGKIKYMFTTQLQSLIGIIFMKIGYKRLKTNWGEYKTDFVLNSDHRKFDDMLRIVISGTAEQRRELETFLKEQFSHQNLAYGMHITDAAVVTCMVFEYYHEHIHFVDGSNGGYVIAAKELQKRKEMFKN